MTLEDLRAKVTDDLEQISRSEPATDHVAKPRDALDGYCEALRWVLAWMGPPASASPAPAPSPHTTGEERTWYVEARAGSQNFRGECVRFIDDRRGHAGGGGYINRPVEEVLAELLAFVGASPATPTTEPEEESDLLTRCPATPDGSLPPDERGECEFCVGTAACQVLINGSGEPPAPGDATTAREPPAYPKCAACGAPSTHQAAFADGTSYPACDAADCQPEEAGDATTKGDDRG